MRVLWLAILLFAAHPAWAELLDQHGRTWHVAMPPLVYFDGPDRTDQITIFQMPQITVTDICTSAANHPEDFGCAFVFPDGGCEVYLATELPTPLREAVQMHEVAHCYGWPADHPQTDPLTPIQEGKAKAQPIVPAVPKVMK